MRRHTPVSPSSRTFWNKVCPNREERPVTHLATVTEYGLCQALGTQSKEDKATAFLELFPGDRKSIE
jgi:hypothetical protein